MQHGRSAADFADWPSGVSRNESSASSSAQPSCACSWGARLRPRTRTWLRDWARGCSSARRSRPRPSWRWASCPSRNPGPLAVVGAGGVLVELLANRAVALPPVSAKLTADMMPGLRVSKLLAGVSGRGQPASTW